MPIPTYDNLYNCFLEGLKDGEVHTLREMVEFCGKANNLTDEEFHKVLPSGTKTYIYDRTSWASTFLAKAGLITKISRGRSQITEAGKAALASGETIDNNYLIRFPSFVAFKNKRNADEETETNQDEPVHQPSLSPQEQIGCSIKELNDELADDLMDEVMKISPYDFEKLVIKLLVAMGYGSKLNDKTAVTKKSGDEGIDGILTADKFGFDSIYIQAKQWQEGSVVGRPEIQKFGGAMMGQGASKGLFITTAKFSKEAVDFAQKNLTSKIVLVDGDALAKLMIEYDIGVSTVETYKIKKVDTDYFTDFD